MQVRPLEGEDMTQHFDRFIMVDWSAANKPTKGKDSIWIAVLEEGEGMKCWNPATRQEAFEDLLGLCKRGLVEAKRTLVGFDFPFGYPAGMADYFSLPKADHSWQRIWSFLNKELEDDAGNKSNRFEVGNALNEKVAVETGPFWGHPSNLDFDNLQMKRPPTYEIAERRLADSLIPKAQPVWKLAYAGSVGSQSLTGIPRVHQLRNHASLLQHTAVWPFEDFRNKPLVLAEVYPSFWDMVFRPEEFKDAQQVKNVVQIMKGAQNQGELTAWMESPFKRTASETQSITTEEAWILGL